MKKHYTVPQLATPISSYAAVPLAFFSASTAAAAAAGLMAGAVGTKAVIKAMPNERKEQHLSPVEN